SGNRPVIGSGNRGVVAGNRPWGAYRPNYGNYPWNRGYWGRWPTYPVAWGAGAATAGWLMSGAGSSPTYVYSNPYYESNPSVAIENVDYTQPMVVPVSGGEPVQPEPAVAQASVDYAEAARTAFRGGDYRQAQSQVEKAIAQMPRDTDLHEFRGLVFFAPGQERPAAARRRPPAGAGHGCSWDTLISFYPDQDTYTKQLRALEKFQRDNPKSPEGHFELAYHYMVLEQFDAAAEQLRRVVALVPSDTLSVQLLNALTQ